MLKQQRSISLLHVRPTLLALLVCALACLAPEYTAAQSVRLPATGHRVEGEFLRFWEQNNGASRLGAPLSAAIWLDGHVAQLFARVRLERRTGEPSGIASIALPEEWQQQA